MTWHRRKPKTGNPLAVALLLAAMALGLWLLSSPWAGLLAGH